MSAEELDEATLAELPPEIAMGVRADVAAEAARRAGGRSKSPLSRPPQPVSPKAAKRPRDGGGGGSADRGRQPTIASFVAARGGERRPAPPPAAADVAAIVAMGFSEAAARAALAATNNDTQAAVGALLGA